MTVQYSGARNYNERVAMICARDDEKDQRMMYRVVDLMQIRGWDLSICGDMAICEVASREEYKRKFLPEYKDCKACIAMCEKYGF